MNIPPEAFPWQTDYIAALLETDDLKLAHRIYEAIGGIEQKLLSPVERECAEEKALQDAQKGILTLQAGRL